MEYYKEMARYYALKMGLFCIYVVGSTISGLTGQEIEQEIKVKIENIKNQNQE
jgi:hypothetical protein